MSRLARKPIALPPAVEVRKADGEIEVKGPLGSVRRRFRDEVTIKIGDGDIEFNLDRPSRMARTLLGTYAAQLKNMIIGVTQGFEKRLVIEGIGYRAAAADGLTLNLGFSHPVVLSIPSGIEVAVEKNVIKIRGVDKEMVGQWAATVRAQKPPEPYKGKGIRYENEVVRRKAGKKVAA